MNKLITLLSFLLFLGCTSDEINQDCYFCETTETTYCIEQGNDFYTISVNNSSTNVPLDNQFWNDIKLQIIDQCENPPLTPDCITCNNINTQYCYTQGDNFYTETTNSNESQIELNGLSWAEIKANLITDCPTTGVIDCYTCASNTTEYCYANGDDFYTETINSIETQIPLNSQTWTEIKTGLEENCPTVITASLVGNWQINDFHGTTVSNTTIAGQTTTIESTQNAITHEAYVSFSENPNEYDGNGFITIESVTNGQTTTYESTPFESGSWVLEGNELFLDGTTVNPGVILELSNTTLTIKYDQTIVSEDNGVTTETILDFTQSYTRL